MNLFNVVLAASAVELPEDEVRRRAASAAFPARCLVGEELTSLVGKAEPITDESPVIAPVPPETSMAMASSSSQF